MLFSPLLVGLTAATALLSACFDTGHPLRQPPTPTRVVYHQPHSPGDAALEYLAAWQAGDETIRQRLRCPGNRLQFGALPLMFGDDDRPLHYLVSAVSVRGPARWRVEISAEQGGQRIQYTHFLVRQTAAGFGVCLPG